MADDDSVTTDSRTLVPHQDAKVYSFKSVGMLNTERRRQFPVIPNEIPIGIKTPIQFGKSNDGLFKMHKKMSDQISDNFRNMLMTNHGERLALYDFGANLEELVHELGTATADSEAIMRITETTRKYMPYVDLDTFLAYQQQGKHGLPNRAGIKVTYSVPKLRMINKTIEVILWTGFETARQSL
jgi:phage baseplate assembly protein W